MENITKKQRRRKQERDNSNYKLERSENRHRYKHENACDVQVKCTNDIVNGISDHYIHTHSIYVELVSNAINHLKLDKNDCIDGLSSDNFKNGTHFL